MNRVQSYLFSRILQAQLVVIGGLVVLIVLAQGLARTDLIVDSRQSALVYLQVVLLGAPQVVAMLGPLGVFAGAVWALNRVHRDSELIVAQAAGMTRWQVASPIVRVAALAALLHMAIVLWIQPAAQRQMREIIKDARADIATALIRPGEFIEPNKAYTIYARHSSGGRLYGLMISDMSSPERPVDYLARSAFLTKANGRPTLVLNEGQRLELDEQGALTILDFDRTPFDLSPLLSEERDVVLKASDRFLWELLFIDPSDYFQAQNQVGFVAEANTRLSAPLLNIAMALLALSAVVGGDFNRRGYARRIAAASAGALGLFSAYLAVGGGAQDALWLSAGLWLIPLATIAWLANSYLKPLGGRGRSPSAAHAA